MKNLKHVAVQLLFTATLLSTAQAAVSQVSKESLKSAAERLEQLAAEEKHESLTWDVTKRGLENRPWLGSNDAIHFRLNTLRKEKGSLEEGRQEASAILEQMITIATEAHKISMQGLTLSQDERTLLQSDLSDLQEAERTELAQITQERQLHQWAKRLYGALPSTNPNGGRLRRMLLGAPAVPFLYTWIWRHVETEDKGPYPHDFENLRLYEANKSADTETLSHLGAATEEELLRLYAPIIVQQVAPDAAYSTDVDRIGAGRVVLTPEGGIASIIDISEPVVYTRTSQVLLNNQWHRQLNYTIWYPEHPSMKSGDPEAGHTEGIMMRLTLDQANHPILAETSFACGCFHRFFPVEALERAATEQFGTVVSGRSPLGKTKTLHVDPIIPQTMGNFSEKAPHPSVYLYSGKHFAGAVEFNGYHGATEETASYALLPEQSLESLPLAGDLHASFFQSDGLVRGADRPEATMLYPTGFYHAGTPRIHDAHLIHFDQYDYNDPLLPEKLLRLPSLGGVLKDSIRSRYARSSGEAPAAPQVPETDDAPRAAKKTFFCPC